MMISRNVFCGATNPRRLVGIFAFQLNAFYLGSKYFSFFYLALLLPRLLPRLLLLPLPLPLSSRDSVACCWCVCVCVCVCVFLCQSCDLCDP